jgi:hypothetical protein
MPKDLHVSLLYAQEFIMQAPLELQVVNMDLSYMYLQVSGRTVDVHNFIP